MQNSMVSGRTTGYDRLTNMVGFTYVLVGVLYNDFIYAHATLPLASRVIAQAMKYDHAWYGLFAALAVGLYFVGQALFPLLISSRFAASMTLTVLSLLNPEAGYVGILLFTLVYSLDGFAIRDSVPSTHFGSSLAQRIVTPESKSHILSDTEFSMLSHETWVMEAMDNLVPTDPCAHETSTSLHDDTLKIRASPPLIDPNTGFNWEAGGWADPFTDLRTL